MSEWKEGFLSDVAEIIMGQSPTGETCNTNGVGVPLLNGPTEFGIKYPEPLQFTSEPKKFSKENDILFCVHGSTTGKMNWSDQEYALGRGLAAIRPKNGEKYRYFIRGVIDSNLSLLLASATGSTFPNVSRDQLNGLEILVPPPDEQKAIASVLSSLDDKIDLLHRQNKTLEAMAETLFRQWFVEEAQDDWKEVKIADFVELNRASIDKNYSYQTIEYLDTGSLISGKIESFQSFSLNDAPSRAKRLVQHNDVLISTVRPDQKHYGIIKNPIENLVVSTGFCVLTCTKIDPHFIYLLLTNNEMTDYLHTIAEGSTSTYPSLKPSDIGSISFQLPPHNRLKEFSVFAQNSWKKIEKNHIQIRTLETLRDTLLPKLMSGEVRVDYP
ncbi:MAG: restriction endonuclease subunit S [Nitrosomonas sp.]|nr:MAG: restriction endonuclease subunit S [Nitrosomonas sp.]